ncbi:MAG: hypothetical protein QXI16_03155, partial [Sulfolobaceae archaeon]
GSGVTAVFGLITNLMTGGIGLFYDTTASKITDMGELALLGGIIGLGFMALNWVFRLIPYAKK